MIPRAVAFATLLASLLFATGPVLAQGISFGGGSSQLRGVIVQASDVAERATAAFAQRSDSLLGSYQSADSERADVPRLEDVASRHVDAFGEALRESLTTLSGDGILHAQEVADALNPLFTQRADDLESALDAVSKGHPPPPFDWESKDGTSFFVAMLRYTFLVRNSASDLAKWLAMAFAGIAIAWALRQIFDRLHRRLGSGGWLRRLLESLTGPLYLSAAVVGLFSGLHWMWVPGLARGTVNEAVNITLIVAAFWLLWNLCDLVGTGLARATEQVVGRDLGTHRRLIMRRTLRIVIGGVFVLVLVHIILDSNLTGVLAGLGVIGIALSFALRNSIENIAASFTIFGDEPFTVGDIVIHDDLWATVEDIGFRSTRLRTFDHHLITVPNAQVVDQAVHNVGARGAIRRRFRIGLEFGTPPEKIREAIDIVTEIISEGDHSPQDATPHVEFESIGDYDLRLLVQYHYQPPDYWEALQFDTHVNLQIMERFAEAGIIMAYPTVTNELRADVLPDLSRATDRESQQTEKTSRERDSGAQREARSESDLSADSPDGDDAQGQDDAGA